MVANGGTTPTVDLNRWRRNARTKLIALGPRTARHHRVRLVATPGIAQAATYDGRDPVSSGCSRSAITARQASIYAGSTRVGVAQLRYSTSCRTVWGRTIAYYSPKGLTQVKRNSDGAYQSCVGFAWVSSLGGYSCYTPMLNDRGVTSYATGWAWTQWRFFNGSWLVGA
jgi:hypothetical protein